MRDIKSRHNISNIKTCILDFFYQNELYFKVSKSKEYDFSFVDSKKGEVACYIQSNIDQNEFSINIDSFNSLKNLLDSNKFNSVYLINNFGCYDLKMLLNNNYFYITKSVILTLSEDDKIEKIQSSNSKNILLRDLFKLLTVEYDKQYITKYLRKYKKIGTYHRNDNPHYVRGQITSFSLALAKILIKEDYKNTIDFIKTPFNFVPDDFEWKGGATKVPQTHPEISRLTIENFFNNLTENIKKDRVEKLVSDNYNPSPQSVYIEFFVTTLQKKLIELLNLVITEAENNEFNLIGLFWDSNNLKNLYEAPNVNYFGEFLSNIFSNESYINKVLKRIDFIDLADLITGHNNLNFKRTQITNIVKEEYHRFLYPKADFDTEFIVTDSDGSGYNQVLGLNKMIPKNLLIYENNSKEYDIQSTYAYVRTLKLEFPDYSGEIFVVCSELTMGAFYLSGLVVKCLVENDLQSHLPRIDTCYCFTHSKLNKIFTNFIESDNKPENIVLKIPYRAVEDRDTLLVRNGSLLFDQLLTYIKYSRVCEILQYRRYQLVHFLIQDKNENDKILINYRNPINIEQIKNKALENINYTVNSYGPFTFEEYYDQSGAWVFSDYYKQKNLSPYLSQKIDNDDNRLNKFGFIPKRFMKIKGVDHFSDQYCYLEKWIKEIEHVEVNNDVFPKKFFSKYDNSDFSHLDISSSEFAEHLKLDLENLEVPSGWINNEMVSFNLISFLRGDLNPRLYKRNRSYKLYKPGSYICLKKNKIQHNKKWDFSMISFDKPFISSNRENLLFEYVRDEYDNMNLTTENDINSFILELNMSYISDQITQLAINPYYVSFNEIKLIRLLKHNNPQFSRLKKIEHVADKMLENFSKKNAIYSRLKKYVFDKGGEIRIDLLPKNIHSKTKITFACAEGHEFISTYQHVVNEKSWCPKCANDTEKEIRENFEQDVIKYSNDRIREFFAGRFHSQKSLIQEPLSFMYNHLNKKNNKDLVDFISCDKNWKRLKKYISDAEKGFDFIEDLYKVYTKPINYITYNVRELCTEIEEKLNFELSRDIKINFVYNLDVGNEFLYTEVKYPEIVLSDEFIEFTLLELKRNTLKYAFNDSVKEKRIDIVFDIDDGSFIIKYRDNGIGFKQYEIDRIFGYRERLSNKENKKSIGSGTGLWHMKSYLGKYNCSIEINTKCEFIISIPFKK